MSKPTVRELAKAIRNLMASNQDSNTLATQIAAYLVAERRTGELEKVMREVERQQLVEDGVMEVTATSARGLNQEIMQEISRIFSGRTVKIIEKRDKNLVGGVYIRTLDEQLDLSVRGQLKGLRNSLKG